MFNRESKNADITQHDWAQKDRVAMLRSVQTRQASLNMKAPSIGWGTDVAGTDPRSVHAYLSGKGDLRTTWWNLYSAAYMATVPGATLERVMYSFHTLHHTLTLFRLSFSRSVTQTATDIEQEGVLVAAYNSVVREMKR